MVTNAAMVTNVAFLPLPQTSRLVGKFLTISAPILPMVVAFTLMQRTLQVSWVTPGAAVVDAGWREIHPHQPPPAFLPFQAMNIVKPVLLIMMVANVLNVFFCYIFIAKFRMGIEGAGIAMVLNSLSPPVLCGLYIWKSGVFAGKFRGMIYIVRECWAKERFKAGEQDGALLLVLLRSERSPK